MFHSQFPWTSFDSTPFHATDDRMLSHIGGSVSRSAKRKKKPKGEKYTFTGNHIGTTYRGDVMRPSTRRKKSARARQHRRQQTRAIMASMPEKRFQLVNNAIPGPETGALIAQHKVAEVSNAHDHNARSWQVAERVQDHADKGHRDSCLAQKRCTVPSAAPRTSIP